VHIEEGPFSCKLCKRAFSKRFNLNIYFRVHTGEQNSRAMCVRKSSINNVT
jgi:hypothetical protein